MMLNEIISITNPGDMLSGTGKSQSLRDGALVGPCQSTDDLDPQQKNFMSVLSQFGNGPVPMVSEEASGSNLKLAQEPLSGDAATDMPASEKLKEKSGKGSAVSKRLSSVHPEVFAFVMGLLSIPDPPQPNQLADPDFHNPCLESEENPDSGLIAGGSTPESMENQYLPDENSILTAIPQMSPAILSDSNLAQAAQVAVSAIQEAKSESVSISGSELSSPDLSQFFQGKLSQMVQGQRQPDSSKITNPAQDSQKVELPAIQEAKPESVSISGSDLSSPDLSQFFQGKLSQMVQGQRQPDPSKITDSAQVFQGVEVPAILKENSDSVLISGSVLSTSDTIHLNPLTGKENPGAMGNKSQRNSASFHQTEDALETDGIASPVVVGTSNAGSIATMDAFKSANSSDIITGIDDGPQLQPPESGSGDSVANFTREAQMEKTSSANLSSKEIRPVNQSFQTEVLKQVVEKSASTLKSGQSEIRIDLEPESLGHLRLHVSMENHQVTVKILAENTQVKEMIERQAYLIKNELQHQGIKVDAVNVDMLMSGGSDFAYSQHEETAFKQARNAPAYGSGQERSAEIEFKEPDSPGQANSRGGYLVNYFA
ncbi:MAG: flagellar hook-length control protein FliK [Pseudomonadota bacterium]